MRTASLICLTALLILSRPSHAQTGPILVVRNGLSPCLVVHVSPAANAPQIACLLPGTTVEGVGTAPYWRRIRMADGRLGWAAKKFLELAGTPTPAPADTGRDDAWLEVHFVDVGQGDGIWIQTFDDGTPGNGRYEGKNIVIDGGPNGADATNPFLAYLLQNSHPGGIVDALILTHPHIDHYPGAQGVVRHFDVCDYYDPGYPKTGPSYAGFLAVVLGGNCNGSPTRTHMGRSNFGTFDWGSELNVEVLWAWPGDSTGLGLDNTIENNASIVLKLTYGTQSILFMGDAEGKDRADGPATPQYAEARLLAEAGPAKLHSTVLKIAHHGSETSSTLPFIQAVDPRFVIVSSGRKSFSGTFLPDATTLARYCAHNPAIRIYRTDQDDEVEHRTTATDADGDHVVVRTNGKTTMVLALSNGSPFAPTSCSP